MSQHRTPPGFGSAPHLIAQRTTASGRLLWPGLSVAAGAIITECPGRLGDLGVRAMFGHRFHGLVLAGAKGNAPAGPRTRAIDDGQFV